MIRAEQLYDFSEGSDLRPKVGRRTPQSEAPAKKLFVCTFGKGEKISHPKLATKISIIGSAGKDVIVVIRSMTRLPKTGLLDTDNSETFRMELADCMTPWFHEILQFSCSVRFQGQDDPKLR